MSDNSSWATVGQDFSLSQDTFDAKDGTQPIITSHSSDKGKASDMEDLHDALICQVVKKKPGRKKGSKKQQWGPVLPLRSSRNLDNYKKVEDKA